MGISWWAFIGVVAVAYAIPGPDFAVILRSATRGLRAGVAAAVGAQTGLLVHMLLAVAGLSVVLARFPDVLTAIRVLGGAYLLYLGGRLVLPTLGRRGHGAASEQSPAGDLSGRSAFIHGLLTNLLNPKAVLFFAAVLPQFVAPDATAPVWAQIAALGVVDVLLGFAAWALVVAAGARLASALRRRRVRAWWDRATGTALGGLGGGLIATR